MSEDNTKETPGIMPSFENPETTIADRLDAIHVDRLSDEQIAQLERLKQELVYVGIDDIHPSSNKERRNDDAVPKVAESIRQLGFRSPIYVNGETNEIIIGHTRWAAAKKLGLRTVPVVFVFDLSPAKMKLLKLADNKAAEFSGWNFEELNKSLDELKLEMPELDMTGLGFTVFDDDSASAGGLPPELQGQDLTPEELADRGGEVSTGGRVIIVFDEERRNEMEELLGVKSLPKDVVTYRLDDILRMRATPDESGSGGDE